MIFGHDSASALGRVVICEANPKWKCSHFTSVDDIGMDPIIYHLTSELHKVSHLAFAFLHLLSGSVLKQSVSKTQQRGVHLVSPSIASHVWQNEASGKVRTGCVEMHIGGKSWYVPKIIPRTESLQGAAYGKCVAAEYQNVRKDMCAQEFMRLKNCYLVSRPQLVRTIQV